MENANQNPNNNIVRNWLSGVGVALVVVVAATFALHSKETLSPVLGDASTTTEATTTTNHPVVTGTGPSLAVTTEVRGEMLSVLNQSAGASVTIDSMTLTRKSWIAVKDTTGRILGAGLFAAGTTKGDVSLLRNTLAGQRYEVLIYVDDGDKQFDLHKDMLVTAIDGSPISTAFNAQ